MKALVILHTISESIIPHPVGILLYSHVHYLFRMTILIIISIYKFILIFSRVLHYSGPYTNYVDMRGGGKIFQMSTLVYMGESLACLRRQIFAYIFEFSCSFDKLFASLLNSEYNSSFNIKSFHVYEAKNFR